MFKRLVQELWPRRKAGTANAAALVDAAMQLRARGDAAGARSAFEAAAAADPGSAEIRMVLGNLAHESGDLDAALDAYRGALALDPANAAVHYNLALTLLSLGEAAQAVRAFRACLALAPDYGDARSSLLYALNMSEEAEAEEISAEHFEWGRRIADPLFRERRHANTPEPGRRLRVGYVTADFFRHAAAPFIDAFLEQHDARALQVFCYVNAPLAPENAARYGHTWREVRGLDDAQLAAAIEADAIDILVDLSGHTFGTRLLAFARKPAPVQMTFLGYPNTTGMRAMDYRLSDAYADPPGAPDARYRESLLRMPHSVWCFKPRADDVADVGELPLARNGYPSFASLNNASKLNDRLLALWAQLLQSLPQARLVMATIAPGRARDRIARAFADRGVDVRRISFRERMPRKEYLALHNEVDIALDAHPCNGGATTCEALWQGVPVVSLTGERFESRAGLSLLANAGLGHLVAQSAHDYLDIARKLAADREQLQRLRAGLRAQLRRSPLMDAPGFTRALEAHYRAAWQTWCQGAR